MDINKYKRQTPRFEIRDKILILCSGETEEIYFNNFKKKYKSSLDNVSVKVEPSKKAILSQLQLLLLKQEVTIMRFGVYLIKIILKILTML